MKKVVFICLLTLSVCFSQPTTAPESNKTPTEAQAPPKVEEKSKEVNSTVPAHETKPAPTPVKDELAKKPTNGTQEKETPKQIADNKTENKDEKTEKQPSPAKEQADKPSKPSSTPEVPHKATEKAPTAETKAEASTPSSTQKAPTTEAPKSATEHPTVQARKFDGASFVGGIILTLGLLAIGFMGFKYYKNQTERNYHTL